MSFLKYTGKVYRKANLYFYEMKNNKNPFKTSCMTKVGNPIIDNLFKYVFLEDKEILKNFLNSILFTGEEEILELVYIPNEYPSFSGEKYGKNSIRIDVGVKCKIGKKFKNKKLISTEDYTIIIDLEMQIGLKEEDTKRFIEYATTLYSKNNVKEVWVVALTFSSIKKSQYHTNKTTKTSLYKKSVPKSAEIKTYNDITIIQIDLNYCYQLLENKKNIWIINPKNILGISGEEWIKYLTIPLWCYCEDGFYLLPDISAKGFFKEECVRDSLLKLSEFNNEVFQNYQKESTLFEKEKSLIEYESRLNKKEESLLEEVNSFISDKDEEIKNLKERNKELEKENKKLRKNKINVEPPKIKQSQKDNDTVKYPKKNKKKIKYPKDSDDDEESDESHDSDYYPDKSDEEENEKENSNDMDLDSN